MLSLVAKLFQKAKIIQYWDCPNREGKKLNFLYANKKSKVFMILIVSLYTF